MIEPEGAKKAIQDPNPVIDGRKANVNLAYLGAKPRVQTGNYLSCSTWTPITSRPLQVYCLVLLHDIPVINSRNKYHSSQHN